MGHAHWPRFAALTVLSFAILFQYQNCAPGAHQDSSATSDQNNIVHAMSGGASQPAQPVQAVQMSSNVVRIAGNQSETSISGSCSEANMPTLNWVLRDPETGEQLDEGTTPCVNNTLNMELATNQRIDCNKVYELSVNDSTATVTRDCQN